MLKKAISFVLAFVMLVSVCIPSFFADENVLRCPCGKSHGDANLDGAVSMQDVVLIQKYIAGLITFTDEQITNSDVSGDKRVRMEDVVLIQQFIANIINVFPVCDFDPGKETNCPCGRYHGDVNLSNTLTMADVVLYQKYIAKMVTFDDVQLVRADVDLDGKYTMIDIVLMQQFIAKIINSFPACRIYDDFFAILIRTAFDARYYVYNATQEQQKLPEYTALVDIYFNTVDVKIDGYNKGTVSYEELVDVYYKAYYTIVDFVNAARITDFDGNPDVTVIPNDIGIDLEKFSNDSMDLAYKVHNALKYSTDEQKKTPEFAALHDAYYGYIRNIPSIARGDVPASELLKCYNEALELYNAYMAL